VVARRADGADETHRMDPIRRLAFVGPETVSFLFAPVETELAEAALRANAMSNKRCAQMLSRSGRSAQACVQSGGDPGLA
jgi:hypothetical protein